MHKTFAEYLAVLRGPSRGQCECDAYKLHTALSFQAKHVI